MKTLFLSGVFLFSSPALACAFAALKDPPTANAVLRFEIPKKQLPAGVTSAQIEEVWASARRVSFGPELSDLAQANGWPVEEVGRLHSALRAIGDQKELDWRQIDEATVAIAKNAFGIAKPQALAPGVKTDLRAEILKRPQLLSAKADPKYAGGRGAVRLAKEMGLSQMDPLLNEMKKTLPPLMLRDLAYSDLPRFATVRELESVIRALEVEQFSHNPKYFLTGLADFADRHAGGDISRALKMARFVMSDAEFESYQWPDSKGFKNTKQLRVREILRFDRQQFEGETGLGTACLLLDTTPAEARKFLKRQGFQSFAATDSTKTADLFKHSPGPYGPPSVATRISLNPEQKQAAKMYLLWWLKNAKHPTPEDWTSRDRPELNSNQFYGNGDYAPGSPLQTRAHFFGSEQAMQAVFQVAAENGIRFQPPASNP